MDKLHLCTPLDLQRNGRSTRAKALGLTANSNSSFEINQSFPRLSRKLKSVSKAQFSKGLLNPGGIDSISFSTQATANSINTNDYLSNVDDSVDEDSVINTAEKTFNPNPNKGVLTIEPQTTRIVMTNNIACKMLGFSNEQILQKKFCELVVREKALQALPDMVFGDNGDITVFNGKVVELLCGDGNKVAVSLWLTRTIEDDEDGNYIAVIEPVQRVVANLLLDEFGMILHADEVAFSLFHTNENNFIGHNIIKWIPNIEWPVVESSLANANKLQRTTGSNESNQSFPLTLRLDYYEGDSEPDLSGSVVLPYYMASVCVFTNMSGMLLIDENSIIIDCNAIFVLLALGYLREQLLGTNLSDILSRFTEPHHGRYDGEILHQSGSRFAVSYFVNGPVDGLDIYQIWMSIFTPTNASDSAWSVLECSLAGESLIRGAVKCAEDPNQVASGDKSFLDEKMFSGEYLEHYQVLKQIGSGGFGCVKLAVRQSDGKLVVTKFIDKSKVYTDSWVTTDDGQRLPFEIDLLSRINHSGVVRMIDFFENDVYFQLVMEKHGFGMDLFEFIEKSNGVAEPLAAFIFKQVAEAVHYLHASGILHRDIKDENIVIDDHFHAKLIDFGSAARLSGQLFSTFCGTFEYCSPEVLRGSPYRGPELEIWSMAVTLYVLVFARNPFAGIEEILRCELEIPDLASEELAQLLAGMMQREPGKRHSIQDVISDAWLNQTVDVSDYDFYQVCEMHKSMVEFQNSRYILDTAPSCLATSTPYKRLKDAKISDNSSLLDDEGSIHFQVAKLVFNDVSNLVE